MTLNFGRCIVFFLLALIAPLCLLAAAGKPSSVNGEVIVDEAQIYSAPDLDAPVLTTATRGVRIPITKGTRGNYARFRKTRVNGRIGWISVLDVKPLGSVTDTGLPKHKTGPFKEESESASSELEEEDKNPKEKKKKERLPFYYTQYIGATVGTVDYKEGINGRDYDSDMTVFGLRMTGPELLDGPPMDLSLLIHYGAPNHYDQLSTSSPRGFVALLDASLIVPIIESQNRALLLGVGPVGILSNIQTSVGSRNYDMWNISGGLNLALSYGFRMGTVAVRLGGRYIWERKAYRGLELSIQKEF